MRVNPSKMLSAGLLQTAMGLCFMKVQVTFGSPVQAVLFALWALTSGAMIGLGIVGMYKVANRG